MTRYTKTFWFGLADRVISTAAQAALGALGTTALIHQVDWRIVAGTAAMASLVAVLKAFATPDNTDIAIATATPEVVA